ncbi:MAG TPA: hypothetical protein VJ965_03135 [Anaerolineales bacterium]|nr:hypothetical protein [Anaerolineales bacterium]
MAPVVHGLEDKYGDHVNFVFIDIDDPANEVLQDELGYLRAWRPYIFFINSEGEIVGDALIGSQPGDVLEQTLIDVLVADGVIGN